MRALILAAGHGVRLGMKKTPKCMVKVNKKPVLEHLVDKLNKAGIYEIVINVHKDYDKIFKYFGTRLLYLYESTLLGADGTEKVLKDWLGEEYIVMNGDTLTNIDIKKLIKRGRESNLDIYFYKERFGGTKYVRRNAKNYDFWSGNGAFYFDIGSPKKLTRAPTLYCKL